MEVLPVIDLMGGKVVHGVAGQRHLYQPIRSPLCADATPRGVAEAFAKLGFQQVYVADLDAIGGSAADWSSLREIAGQGLRIWLDAGTGRPESVRQLLQSTADQALLTAVIVGLESVASPTDLRQLAESIGSDRAVFSLDLRAGEPLFQGQSWRDQSPVEIADRAWAAGFRRLIVLDLAGVGTGAGNLARNLCRELRNRQPGWQLISGGGVRGLDDLRELSEAGCDVALVASALHAGRLSSADVRRLQSTRSA